MKLKYNGQGIEFHHPSELTRVHPTPPFQTLSEFAPQLAAFRTECAALAASADGGERAQKFRDARGVLVANHLQAEVADVPEGALASLSACLVDEYGPQLASMPGHFGGGAAWLP